MLAEKLNNNRLSNLDLYEEAYLAESIDYVVIPEIIHTNKGIK